MSRIFFNIWMLIGFASASGATDTSVDTRGPCSPAIAKVEGAATIVVYCNLSAEEKRKTAQQSLQLLIDDLNLIVSQKEMMFLPSLEAYRKAPSPERWDEVREEAAGLLKLVRAAKEALVAYDAALGAEIDPVPSVPRPKEIIEIREVLFTPSITVHRILREVELAGPPGQEALERWVREFQDLLTRTRSQLIRINILIRKPI